MPPNFSILFIIFLLFSNNVFAKAQTDTQESIHSRPAKNINKTDKIYGLSYFWREARYNFGHWDQVPTLDWDKAYKDFIPRILATETDFDYFYELMRFSALLSDGHTNIFMPEHLLSERAFPPIVTFPYDGNVVVVNTAKIIANKIPLGSIITHVDGREINDVAEASVRPVLSLSGEHMRQRNKHLNNIYMPFGSLMGLPNSEVTLTIILPEGKEQNIKVKRTYNFQTRKSVEWVKERKTTPTTEFKKLDNNVVYIALNTMANDEVVADFKRYLNELARAKAIVIDLRKNGGGSSSRSKAILNYFTNKPYKAAKSRMPHHVGAYMSWGATVEEYKDFAERNAFIYITGKEIVPNKSGPTLTVPTYVLIGNDTASAAEDFVVMADSFENFTFVGEATNGSTGQPIFFELPGGGQARISSKRDYYPDGREFIGPGVKPHVFVKESFEDYMNNRDPVLEKAIELIKLNCQKNECN